MNKFTIHWCEWHNPINWTDSEEANKFDKYQKKTLSLLKEGIKRILESFPVKKWHFDRSERDGWIEIICELTAKTLQQAIILAEENCIGNGVDVFSIFKDNNYSEPVFTEENL